ncbi:MAG: collagen-binding domain-containing protein [Akkermansiaceae bacterium]
MKLTSRLIVSTALLSASMGHAQTLGSAANYDILLLGNGSMELKDANQLFGDVGLSSGSELDGKGESTIFDGTIFKHNGATITNGGGLAPSNGIQSSGAINGALNTANADVTNYINYLEGLTADATYGPQTSTFSFATTKAQTVLDFTEIDLDGESFSLTGRAGGTDQIIIRTSDFLEFKESDLNLTNFDIDNVIWYHSGSDNFDLHKSDSDPANFMKFAGTVIAPNAETRIGEVSFNGRLIGGELKLGSGFEFEGPPNPPNPPNPPVIPEPSSSLMLILGAAGFLLRRRRES